MANNVDEYRAEFKSIISENPDFLIEYWSTEPELLEVFYCLVRCMRPHTIVEIGTYKGRSAFALASAQKRNNYVELYTIDDNREGTVPDARARLESLGRAEKINLLESNSQAAFAEWIRAKIDFLYIDGSHTYLDAATDFSFGLVISRKSGASS